ncbi:rhodanese-like domain-containing protein [Cellvibrio sp. ARAG 10.3]|uniref:rhodanese-like domain-containing protein n=1 Tax=Cellvibrio sp. ARAG 10.3 TaxID=3451358 RepID=UPI002C15978F|nr:rhodanese-like domain-containing protein [Cellvibrio sp.]
MNFFVFISQEWLLVSTLVVLIYIYAWRERIKSGRPISVHEVTQLLNKDSAVLLDVRDSAEFKAGHIVGAINIPFSKVAAELDKLESYKSKIIIVADKLGQHAGSVGRTLEKQGFVVRRLSGGIAEWQAQNLPLVKK